MTWPEAVAKACQLHERTGHRWYVRGTRIKGGWTYGCFAIPNPTIARARQT